MAQLTINMQKQEFIKSLQYSSCFNEHNIYKHTIITKLSLVSQTSHHTTASKVIILASKNSPEPP